VEAVSAEDLAVLAAAAVAAAEPAGVFNHGYESQSKLRGIISLLTRDNSANKLRFAFEV
jgi:hypothetical protein